MSYKWQVHAWMCFHDVLIYSGNWCMSSVNRKMHSQSLWEKNVECSLGPNGWGTPSIIPEQNNHPYTTHDPNSARSFDLKDICEELFELMILVNLSTVWDMITSQFESLFQVYMRWRITLLKFSSQYHWFLNGEMLLLEDARCEKTPINLGFIFFINSKYRNALVLWTQYCNRSWAWVYLYTPTNHYSQSVMFVKLKFSKNPHPPLRLFILWGTKYLQWFQTMVWMEWMSLCTAKWNHKSIPVIWTKLCWHLEKSSRHGWKIPSCGNHFHLNIWDSDLVFSVMAQVTLTPTQVSPLYPINVRIQI